ncbi:MAG: hypothetical protein PVH19_03740, partial [Planctomycetia bacterium]
MADHITNRDAVIQALREELVGPCPQGEEIDCTQTIQFDDKKSAYRPYRQRGNGEEILQRDSPTKRYGVGVLYPMPRTFDETSTSEELETQLLPLEEEGELITETTELEPLTELAARDCEVIAARSDRSLPDADNDDFDLSSANAYKPSSMAVSLLVCLPEGAKLSVTATGGRYAIKPVVLVGREREWWLRSPVRLSSRFERADFPTGIAEYARASESVSENIDNLDVRLEIFARPHGTHPDEFLITVCLVNRQQAPDLRLDLNALFQCRIDVQVESADSGGVILPYPTAEPLDSEERSQELLYREKLTFAVGHGCAADWKRGDTPDRAICVSAECLPVFETPNMTPDICSHNGQPLIASMRLLAGVVAG